MNPLIQTTKTLILERQILQDANFWDYHILNAIEAYESHGSLRYKVKGFFDALMPIWQDYNKEKLHKIFEKFIEMEVGLEIYSSTYSSHANHVIQEFLFGYNIITNSSFMKDTYEYEVGKQNSRSRFGKLFFFLDGCFIIP